MGMQTPWGLAMSAAGSLYERTITGQEPSLMPGTPSAHEGWCYPGDASWTLFNDPSAVVAVILAMLRQAMHPTMAEAFLEHDQAARDPWVRIRLTSGFYFTTTFGRAEDAELWVQRARKGHRPVRGVTSWGEAYSASEDHLLAWAHLCVLDSTLRAWDAFGGGPALGTREKDMFCREQALAAALIGVQAPPMSYQSLARQLNEFGQAPRPSAAGAQAARNVLAPPLDPWLLGPYLALAEGALALLTRQERHLLGIARPVLRKAGSAAVQVLRRTNPELTIRKHAGRVRRHSWKTVPAEQPLRLTGSLWDAGIRFAKDHPVDSSWAAEWFLADAGTRQHLISEARARASAVLTPSGDVRADAAAAGAWQIGEAGNWALVWRRAGRRS